MAGVARVYRLGPARRVVNTVIRFLVPAMVAGPVLRRYVQDVKVTRPYFDLGPADPEAAFVGEAAKHPVFELTPESGPPGS